MTRFVRQDALSGLASLAERSAVFRAVTSEGAAAAAADAAKAAAAKAAAAGPRDKGVPPRLPRAPGVVRMRPAGEMRLREDWRAKCTEVVRALVAMPNAWLLNSVVGGLGAGARLHPDPETGP
jgi:hypothetical protein